MRLSDFATVAFVVLAVGVLLCPACRKPPAQPRPAPASETVSEPPPVLTTIESRTVAKRQLAHRVIAERIPLLEAAEMFRLANGEDGMQRLTWQITMGATMRERLCRQVIAYVSGVEDDMEAAGHAPTNPPVSALLQAELDRRLAAGEFAPESK
jgi:hypothetical protein